MMYCTLPLTRLRIKGFGNKKFFQTALVNRFLRPNKAGTLVTHICSKYLKLPLARSLILNFDTSELMENYPIYHQETLFLRGN